MRRAQKMKRNIRLIANDPAVVRSRRNVEQLTCAKLNDSTILESSRRCPREDKPDVLDVAVRRADGWPNVPAPAPAGLVDRATDGNPANMDDLETAILEVANFVWCVESLQNNL